MRSLALIVLVACGDKKPADSTGSAAPKPAAPDAATPVPIDAALAPPSSILAMGKPLSPGCFAYSRKLEAWACVVAELAFENSQRDGKWEIAFPGAKLARIDIDGNRTSHEPGDYDALPVLAGDVHASVEKLLAEHEFGARPPGQGQVIKPKQTVKLDGDRVSVRWQREKHRGPADGEYHVWQDTLQIECKTKWVEAWKAEMGDPAVQVAAVGSRVLVEWQITAGREGGRASDHGARVFSLDTCAAL
jgi:hypothetical protein